jgi:uncharacterized protein YbjQ (UPF0145 family)
MSLPGFRSMLAVLSAGFEPRGVVMGALALQLYQPSCALGLAAVGAEPTIFPIYEQSLRDAWKEAIARLEREAAKSGAHGVVGVSVNSNASTGLAASAGVREFRLVGTCVVVPGAPPLKRPFVSMLSMDDTLKLLLRGWVPTGIAVGISAVHVHGWAASPVRRRVVTKNAEMEAPTAGMALARSRAEHEARRSLVAVRAEGMVAAQLTVTRSMQPCGGGQGMLIEGRLSGTGVAHYRDPVVSVSAVRNLTTTGAP